MRPSLRYTVSMGHIVSVQSMAQPMALLSKMPTAALHAGDGAVDACGHHAAVTGAHGLTLLRA